MLPFVLKDAYFHIFFCISAKKGEYPQNKKGIIKKKGKCFPKTFGGKIKKGVKFRGGDILHFHYDYGNKKRYIIYILYI